MSASTALPSESSESNSAALTGAETLFQYMPFGRELSSSPPDSTTEVAELLDDPTFLKIVRARQFSELELRWLCKELGSKTVPHGIGGSATGLLDAPSLRLPGRYANRLAELKEHALADEIIPSLNSQNDFRAQLLVREALADQICHIHDASES